MLQAVQRLGGVVYSMMYATGRLAFTLVSRRPSLDMSRAWGDGLGMPGDRNWVDAIGGEFCA